MDCERWKQFWFICKREGKWIYVHVVVVVVVLSRTNKTLRVHRKIQELWVDLMKFIYMRKLFCLMEMFVNCPKNESSGMHIK